MTILFMNNLLVVKDKNSCFVDLILTSHARWGEINRWNHQKNLKRRKRGGNDVGHSTVISEATSQLTRVATIVTIVFILTVGPEAMLYMLDSLGAAEYIINSPLQKCMVFLSLLNSSANPVVYLYVLPSYRREVIKLFQRRENQLNTTVNTPEASCNM